MSVVDRHNNAVAVTCTIEQPFGSGVVARGTGFLLNNELSDFDGPGTANEPEGGKRPRSSQTPTLVVHQGRTVLVLGAAGSALIIMAVLNAIVIRVDHGLDLAHAVDNERVYSEGCCTVSIENARILPGSQLGLLQRGHVLVPVGESGGTVPLLLHMGIMEAAGVGPDTGERVASSDPRGEWGSAGQQASD